MTFRGRAILLAPALLLALGCGGDSSVDDTPAPSKLLANSTTTMSALVGTTVVSPPSVIVEDQHNAAMAGVPVTFTVTGGGGEVIGGDAVTDEAGIATATSWSVGFVAGVNHLTASAGSAPHLVFTATGVAPCNWTTPFGLGTPVFGALTPIDCQLGDGSYIDFFSTSLGATQAFVITEASDSVDPFLYLLAPDYSSLAFNNDSSGLTLNASMKVLLSAGNYILGANALNPGEVGSYTLSSVVTDPDAANCENIFIVKGVGTDQNITAADCVDSGGPYYGDGFYVFLKGGQMATIQETSTAFDTYLQLFDAVTGAQVAFNDDLSASSTDSRILYTPSASGYFFIFATTYDASIQGTYTLSVH